jgi:hypothetical protein
MEQLRGIEDTFGNDLTVDAGRVEAHDFRDHHAVISVDICDMGWPTLHEEHQALFDSVSRIGKEILVFIVDDLDPSGWLGCAHHPPLNPGLIITHLCEPRWVLAHELGHVLGRLDDLVMGAHLLMWGSANWNADPPPMFQDHELAACLHSQWLS